MLLPALCSSCSTYRTILIRKVGFFRCSIMSQTTSSNLPKSNLVAVCQMTSTDDKETNFKTCDDLIHRAAEMGAKVTFLPECCDYVGNNSAESVDMAISLDGKLVSRFKNLAKKCSMWLSLGGIHLKEVSEKNRISNAHVMINSNGEIAAVYKKTHLFDVNIPKVVTLMETGYTIPGQGMVEPVVTPVGNVGLAVCYDVRFPELSIALAEKGADILTYPSAFTQTTGMAHWEVLLRSRAIENQCYVVAAAQTGKHNDKRTSYGHAMIVDPWGTVLACCREGTDVCVANIDLNYLQSVRQRMPIWNHRRHDIYGHVLFNDGK
ncbi:deaminated glutathione amidase-like isoform X2 [Anneissia japonica]|uniref:deaminated glutathione amidase-like isoform X2 n=1 Tax=Anneissia japonica TaxID=1529436 RepID=UPI001425B44A|nr:deaminated glutathione amidase-like isoform X2 [Anneissia japonica]